MAHRAPYRRAPIVLSAAALAILLAACEGNDIPPPDRSPLSEETEAPETEGTTIDREAEPTSVEDEIAASPTQNPDDAVRTDVVEDEFANATAQAEQRAEEILAEVTEQGQTLDAPEGDQTIADLAPDTAPAESAPQSVAGAPAAAGMVPDASLLAADTREALTFSRDGGAPRYAGVWAPRGVDCELVDQPGFEDFAVIGAETMRVQGNQCSVSPGALESGTATVEGTCQMGGTDVPASFTVSLSSAGDLVVTEPALDIDGRYVRCEAAQ